MSARNRFLVAYDVSDAKRLRKVFQKMHGYGDPLQYSVFCCNLSPKERALMIADLDALIHHDEDRVIIVDLGPQPSVPMRRETGFIRGINVEGGRMTPSEHGPKQRLGSPQGGEPGAKRRAPLPARRA